MCASSDEQIQASTWREHWKICFFFFFFAFFMNTAYFNTNSIFTFAPSSFPSLIKTIHVFQFQLVLFYCVENLVLCVFSCIVVSMDNFGSVFLIFQSYCFHAQSFVFFTLVIHLEVVVGSSRFMMVCRESVHFLSCSPDLHLTGRALKSVSRAVLCWRKGEKLCLTMRRWSRRHGQCYAWDARGLCILLRA